MVPALCKHLGLCLSSPLLVRKGRTRHFFGIRLTLQRHLSVLTKSTHVESRFCGRSRQVKAAFCTPVNPCVRSVCSRSVVVGIIGHTTGSLGLRHLLEQKRVVSLFDP